MWAIPFAIALFLYAFSALTPFAIRYADLEETALEPKPGTHTSGHCRTPTLRASTCAMLATRCPLPPARVFPIWTAIARFQTITFQHRARGSVGLMALRAVAVEVADINAPLQMSVDESYTLDIPDANTTILLRANTYYGALHVLETLRSPQQHPPTGILLAARNSCLTKRCVPVYYIARAESRRRLELLASEHGSWPQLPFQAHIQLVQEQAEAHIKAERYHEANACLSLMSFPTCHVASDDSAHADSARAQSDNWAVAMLRLSNAG